MESTETLELFLKDLTEEAQQKLINFLGENGNYDVIPIVAFSKEGTYNG